MAFNISSVSENLKVHPEIKIGIIALFANVFVGLGRLIIGFVSVLTGSVVVYVIWVVLETIAVGLTVIFGISFYYLSKLFENDTGIWGSISYLIFYIITYLGIFFGIFVFWDAIIFFNGFVVFLSMFLLIFFFLLNISKKYEENIILVTAFVWLVATITGILIFIPFPLYVQIPYMVRDFFTAWCFAVIITKEEESSKPSKKKDIDYKHVKVTYKADDD